MIFSNDIIFIVNKKDIELNYLWISYTPNRYCCCNSMVTAVLVVHRQKKCCTTISITWTNGKTRNNVCNFKKTLIHTYTYIVHIKHSNFPCICLFVALTHHLFFPFHTQNCPAPSYYSHENIKHILRPVLVARCFFMYIYFILFLVSMPPYFLLLLLLHRVFVNKSIYNAL